MKDKQFGLILNPVEEDHWMLGGISGVSNRPTLMVDGHGWGAYKPAPELQNKNGLETMNCTNYGTNNALETLASFHGFEAFPKDCSERYGGIGTGTGRGGNDPHRVIEHVRTVIGVIPEAVLPFDESINTWEEYYSPQNIETLVALGSRILQNFKIQHDWVFNSEKWSTDKPKQLIEALKVGTVAVSVHAWKLGSGGLYYKSDGDGDNHWLQLLDYKEGEYWLVYDHYEQVEKKLKWHYNFFAAKVYYMEKIAFTEKKSFWDLVWDNFTKLFA